MKTIARIAVLPLQSPPVFQPIYTSLHLSMQTSEGQFYTIFVLRRVQQLHIDICDKNSRSSGYRKPDTSGLAKVCIHIKLEIGLLHNYSRLRGRIKITVPSSVSHDHPGFPAAGWACLSQVARLIERCSTLRATTSVSGISALHIHYVVVFLKYKDGLQNFIRDCKLTSRTAIRRFQ